MLSIYIMVDIGDEIFIVSSRAAKVTADVTLETISNKSSSPLQVSLLHLRFVDIGCLDGVIAIPEVIVELLLLCIQVRNRFVPIVELGHFPIVV